MPTLIVSAAWTLKLIPIAITEADNAKAFKNVRRCIISLLKIDLLKVPVQPDKQNGAN
jgi:hypothetical protein